MKTLMLALEKAKASISAKVEHPFHVIKNLFGHRKVRYKGLAKNQAQLFALENLAWQPDRPAARRKRPPEVVRSGLLRQ